METGYSKRDKEEVFFHDYFLAAAKIRKPAFPESFFVRGRS
jgi:hypothetical protein